MNDHKLLLQVSFIFILLGLGLPFYLPSEWGQLPLGISFLADGILLLFIGLIAWGYTIIEEAKNEDQLQEWLEKRDDRFNIKL